MGNILNVVFEEGSTTYRASEKIWQYNYGQLLRLQGFRLPKAAEVQFSYTERGGESITRIAASKDNVADVVIPDSMLENSDIAQDYKLYAFVYVEDGNSGTTEYKITISVRSRPKPEMHESPETEEIFKETVRLVNQYANEAEASKQSAEQSAMQSAESARSAQQSAADAETTKEEVEMLGKKLEEARNTAVEEVNTLKQDSLNAIESEKVKAVETVQEQETSSKSVIKEYTDEEIERANTNTSEAKNQLDNSINAASTAKSNLDTSTRNAILAKSALDGSISDAGSAKTALDDSTRNADKAKTALDNSATNANISKSNLDKTNETASNLDASLQEKITEGNQLKEDIISEGQKQLNIVQQASEEIVADRDQIAKNTEDLNKIAVTCCEKITVSPTNYNLLKISEITYKSRLQDDSAEITTSNVNNCVSGFIPVKTNKFYTLSVLIDGVRRNTRPYGNQTYLGRVNGKTKDGSVKYNIKTSLLKDNGINIAASKGTIKIEDTDIASIQFQIATDVDISTEENFKSHQPMFVEGDTLDSAINNALNLEYIDGDEVLEDTYEYALKRDDTKLDKQVFEEEKNNIFSATKNQASIKYNDNYIPNERFIRGIANLRDPETSRAHNITITNKSGSTIKNATIAVALHNTVGIVPSDNNTPFQIYDEIFSEPIGFKFFDGDKELSFYIESESDCNYIIDRNLYTHQKTLAVFHNGNIAFYDNTIKMMKLTTDAGKTSKQICTNVSSMPYRILLPDSQDNLFIASSDGYKLYKYTSEDEYQIGKEVIDMESYNAKIGSILAEDRLGNLYLGTYQASPWNCTIRKSTDHGDTWNIVFTTTSFQHVHNIFINKRLDTDIIFIGLDGTPAGTYYSKDYGETWEVLNVPFGNRDYAFRYAGENFYIGCGERLYLGGSTIYKTTDCEDPDAYYPIFDNGQGIRDITNVIEGSDDVLIAGGCVGSGNYTEQLYLSEDRGETWKTVFMRQYYTVDAIAGFGLRTFSKRENEILSQTANDYVMRFTYGNGAKTILTLVNVGDIPVEGKIITLKTGYVTNVEEMRKVLTSYETIESKVADIHVCDGYVIDKISNKRVLCDTEKVNHNIKIGQTSEYKILDNHAYKLNGSVNLGKLKRLNFTKGFTVSLLFRKEDGKEYLQDSKYHVIFKSGNTKLVLWYRSIVLMHENTIIYGKKLYLSDAYLWSVNDDYVRVTVTISSDELPKARIFTENYTATPKTFIECTEYPITENLSENDFVVGNDETSELCDAIPNIARIEIYNRVLSYGEIFSLTNGCNLIPNNSYYN